jgi:hypothetical protein
MDNSSPNDTRRTSGLFAIARQLNGRLRYFLPVAVDRGGSSPIRRAQSLPKYVLPITPNFALRSTR